MKRLTIATAALALLSGILAHADGKRGKHAERLAEDLERALSSTPQRFQFANLRDISFGSEETPAAGGAFLIRSKNRLDARVMVADLTAGHAYTFWWIIFNDPGRCAQTPCAAADLMNARGAIHYASGAVAAANGVANASFSTNSGGPPDGAPYDTTLLKRGLATDHGFRAEVHLVLVDHGVPGLADFTSANPDVPGTWGWELTHPLPPGPTWVRAAIFLR
jgi:hypothetical protein